MSADTFKDKLKIKILESLANNYSDNWPGEQLGPEKYVEKKFMGFSPSFPTLKKTFIEILQKTLNEIPRLSLRVIKETVKYYFYPSRYYELEISKFIGIQFLYDLVQDSYSKKILVEIFAYKILGHRKIKLSRNTANYWLDIESLSLYKTLDKPIKIKFMDKKLPRFDLKDLGFRVNVHASSVGIACAFIQKQYEYHIGDIHCKAEPGDVVIDAGGCWGETTLYFADQVGDSGHVFSFDFIPSNLEIMRANIQLNPHLASWITLIENPLWSESNVSLYYVDWGPGSRVTKDKDQYSYDGMCETITIDDIVNNKNISTVNFIKMDIEGAELYALKGAENTIRKFRPKLSISIYHQLSDYESIPRWIDSLNSGYKFYVDHHTIHENETVLFAIPDTA
ncbi:FkbM family methyltransferase [Methylophilaceae bacterium]|nr:FkbM family methyltransferase [Methylophilaceae bacterium]